MANDLIREEYPVSIFYAHKQDEGEHWISLDTPKRWTDNPMGVDPDYPYEFVCKRIYTYTNKEFDNTKGWQPWSIDNIALWSHYGLNATPFLLLLGNPYETIYALKNVGAANEEYVVLDKDGVTTGEIIFQGGYEDKDASFNLNIDKIVILDASGNTEYGFDESNYVTINLGDNWNCRFELQTKNGHPVINLVGIGPNPETRTTVNAAIAVNPEDPCFYCDLNGKYLKRIAIKAYNDKKNVTAIAQWTISAIRDKNGDGIYRYRIVPNIDRIVRNSYYKRQGEDPNDVQLIKDVWNIGSAFSVKFDVERDTYGKAWSDVTNLNFKIVFISDLGAEMLNKSYTSSPAIIPIDDLKDLMGEITGENVLMPSTKQYSVELRVEDPDYGEGFCMVDKCNMLFEYIVSESGKDGENGKDGINGTNGASTMFNLSNDSGTFGYDYKESEVVINKNDCSTRIQYAEEANFIACDQIDIGSDSFTSNGSGTIANGSATLYYNLEKLADLWELRVSKIESSSYTSVLTIPITGLVDGRTAGSATFKMIGIKDINEDGVYAYRLSVEHPYTALDSGFDTLEVDVYRDAMIMGSAYNDSIPILVQVIAKDNGEELGKNYGNTSCESPVKDLDTTVSLKDIQEHKGAIVKVYVKDADYEDRTEYEGYYYTGEFEEIAYTAPGGEAEIDYDELASKINLTVCDNDSIIIMEGKTYTIKFTDIAGNPKPVNLSIPTAFFENYRSATAESTYTLTALSSITAAPVLGTMEYSISGKTVGTIKYTWIGDLNNDGKYYDYEIMPSALVIGYEDEGAFKPDSVNIYCHRTKHEGKIKTSELGEGYLVLGDQKAKITNGKVTLTLGTSGDLHYNGTDSFSVKWYTEDADFAAAGVESRLDLDGTKKFYLVDEETIDMVPTKLISGATITKIFNLIGQASRIRKWDATSHYFPIITGINLLEEDEVLDFISECDNSEWTTESFEIGETTRNLKCPLYYDIVYHGTTASGTLLMWKAKGFNKDKEPVRNSPFWEEADQYDFIAANSAYIENLAAKTVQAEKILVKGANDRIVAGMVNGSDSAFQAILDGGNNGLPKDPEVMLFAGLPNNAKSIEDANFVVKSDGSGKFSGDVEAKTFKAYVNRGSDDNGVNGYYILLMSVGDAKLTVAEHEGKSVADISIDGLNSNVSDSDPIILIYGRTGFFVLNPLSFSYKGASTNFSFRSYFDKTDSSYLLEYNIISRFVTYDSDPNLYYVSGKTYLAGSSQDTGQTRFFVCDSSKNYLVAFNVEELYNRNHQSVQFFCGSYVTKTYFNYASSVSQSDLKSTLFGSEKIIRDFIDGRINDTHTNQYYIPTWKAVAQGDPLSKDVNDLKDNWGRASNSFEIPYWQGGYNLTTINPTIVKGYVYYPTVDMLHQYLVEHERSMEEIFTEIDLACTRNNYSGLISVYYNPSNNSSELTITDGDDSGTLLMECMYGDVLVIEPKTNN